MFPEATMNEKTRTEEFSVNGEELLTRIKALIHEGNVRWIIIRDKQGQTFMEIPLTVGVAGVLFAPTLAAIGAIAALVGEANIVVEKTGE
jgi:hypothetical protein